LERNWALGLFPRGEGLIRLRKGRLRIGGINLLGDFQGKRLFKPQGRGFWITEYCGRPWGLGKRALTHQRGKALRNLGWDYSFHPRKGVYSSSPFLKAFLTQGWNWALPRIIGKGPSFFDGF